MTKAILVLEMPKNCYQCPYCDYKDNYCVLCGENMETQAERTSWCPLKELPSCKDCKFNYNNIEKDSLCVSYEEYDNMTDIVCTYWESDGLTPNDYCSQWKEKEENK